MPDRSQDDHRTIMILGLESSEIAISEEGARQLYGSHNEKRPWERGTWYKNKSNIRTPNLGFERWVNKRHS